MLCSRLHRCWRSALFRRSQDPAPCWWPQRLPPRLPHTVRWCAADHRVWRCFSRYRPRATSVRLAALVGTFLAIACAPMAIWLARSLDVAGNATGGRTLGVSPTGKSVVAAGRGHRNWVVYVRSTLHSEEAAASRAARDRPNHRLPYFALRCRRVPGSVAGPGLADLHVATSIAYLAWCAWLRSRCLTPRHRSTIASLYRPISRSGSFS